MIGGPRSTTPTRLFAIVGLGLGVGLNTAILALADTLFLRHPIGIEAPNRLFRLGAVTNYVDFRELAGQVRSMELAAYARVRLSASKEAESFEVNAECVTGNYFATLGVKPWTGRLWLVSENPGPLAVVSFDFWRRRLAHGWESGSSSIRLDGQTYAIVAVAPRGFSGAGLGPVDLWIPVTSAPATCSFTGSSLVESRDASWLRTVARLRGQFDVSEAEAEVLSHFAQNSRVGIESLIAARRDEVGRQGYVALLMTGGTVLMLLVVCSNVAGILSLRVMERARSISIRKCLGASGTRIARDLVYEQLTFAAMCAAVAVAVACAAASALDAYFSQDVLGALTSWRSVSLFILIIGAAVALSVIPSLLAAVRLGQDRFYRSASAIAQRRSIIQPTVIIAQVAGAVILSVASVMFLQSVRNATSDLGYDLQVVVVRADLDRRNLGDDFGPVVGAMAAAAERIPGVESVSISSGAFLGMDGPGRLTAVQTGANQLPSQFLPVHAVSIQYFRTMGISLAAGRTFRDSDTVAAPAVVIIDQDVASALWPGEDPLGKCVLFVGRRLCTEVVGVSRALRRGSLRSEAREFLIPIAQIGLHGFGEVVPRNILIRTDPSVRVPLDRLVAGIKAAVPAVRFVTADRLSALADAETKAWRLGGQVLAGFGITALSLCGLGLYVLVSKTTHRRRRELAIRAAIGATPRSLVWMITRQSLILISIGCIVGVWAAVLAGSYLAGVLYNVRAADPATVLILTVGTGAIAFSACVLPAWGASQHSVVIGLRDE